MAEEISFHDEWHALMNFAKDLHVILVQETEYMKGDCYRRPNCPCTWARQHGAGRVFHTSLGHREDVWTNPFFQTIALGGRLTSRDASVGDWVTALVDRSSDTACRLTTHFARPLK